MSIFTKILGPIIRPVVKKEVYRIMKEELGPIVTTVLSLADKYGTKFLVALIGIGGVGYLAYSDKVDGLYASIGIALIALGYFFWRGKEDVSGTSKITQETTPSTEDDSE